MNEDSDTFTTIKGKKLVEFPFPNKIPGDVVKDRTYTCLFVAASDMPEALKKLDQLFTDIGKNKNINKLLYVAANGFCIYDSKNATDEICKKYNDKVLSILANSKQDPEEMDMQLFDMYDEMTIGKYIYGVQISIDKNNIENLIDVNNTAGTGGPYFCPWDFVVENTMPI